MDTRHLETIHEPKRRVKPAPGTADVSPAWRRAPAMDVPAARPGAAADDTITVAGILDGSGGRST